MAERQFAAIAMLRLLDIVNAWPCPDRKTMLVIDRLASNLELNDADRVAIGWRAAGTGEFEYQSSAILAREISDGDAEKLLRMAENPPDGMEWTRREAALMNAIIEPLGGQGWIAAKEKE